MREGRCKCKRKITFREGKNIIKCICGRTIVNACGKWILYNSKQQIEAKQQ